MTGQRALEIPPGEDLYTVTGECPESCLKEKLKSSIFITQAHVHMHYLGEWNIPWNSFIADSALSSNK